MEEYIDWWWRFNWRNHFYLTIFFQQLGSVHAKENILRCVEPEMTLLSMRSCLFGLKSVERVMIIQWPHYDSWGNWKAANRGILEHYAGKVKVQRASWWLLLSFSESLCELDSHFTTGHSQKDLLQSAEHKKVPLNLFNGCKARSEQCKFKVGSIKIINVIIYKRSGQHWKRKRLSSLYACNAAALSCMWLNELSAL